MLSIFAISTSQGMSAYYDSDGYYARDDAYAQSSSQWFGRGAAQAGLTGPVNPEDFQRILDGEAPDGRLLGRYVDGERQHRAGIDLTFSAPKSVSLMALMAGDDRLLKAHDEAVKSTLGTIEKNILETRVWDRSLQTQVKERDVNMVAALFRHEVNRNMDPQLHTHAVIANMVQAQDGKWRSIEGASLFHHKMELGALYRAELAMNVRELGYEVERTHMDGRFEIKGLSPQTLARFSSRSSEIRTALEGYDHQNAKTAAVATLMTRNHKTTVDRTELHQKWRDQGTRLGLPHKIAAPSFAQSQPEQETRLAQEAVNYGIHHLSERASVFTLSDLRTTANSYGVGRFRPRTLDQIIAHHADLRPSHHPSHAGQEYVTTTSAQQMERATIAHMQAAQRTVIPFLTPTAVAQGLNQSSLNEDQRTAVQAVLSSQDRIIGIQGYAGVGKTTLLSAVRELAVKQGYTLQGLAPSASAAHTLETEAGIASQTLQKFLGQHDGYLNGRGTAEGKTAAQDTYKSTILVVDESSLAGTRHMHDLMKITDVLRPARVVLVGDHKQLDAVEAGKPFHQLQQNGLHTIHVNDIVRQKNAHLKAAVEASITGHIRQAFEKIGDRLIEAKDKTQDTATAREQAMAQRTYEVWAKLPKDIQGSTGITAPTHSLRHAITDHIRAHLQETGRLSGPISHINALTSAGYTTAEKTRARNYFTGDTVVLNRDIQGLKQGETADVIGHNAKTNSVALKSKEGKTFSLSVSSRRTAQSLDILRVHTLQLQAGDRIRFTRNDEGKGLINSATATVDHVDKSGSVSFTKEDGSRLKLDAQDTALRFIDHAWATTVHGFQGRTVDHIIGVMPANHPHLTHQKSFYVEISRARHSATIITDDKTQLLETLTQKTGERIAALEASPLDKENESGKALDSAENKADSIHTGIKPEMEHTP